MRFAHCLVAGVAGSAVLFAGPAIAARFDPSAGSVDDPRLSGPGVDISVAIPTGWHQVTDQSHPQLPQMVYHNTCSPGATCASAINAQTAAEAAEQAVVGQPGIQGATIIREGPIQVAGRSGHYVRFSYS